MQRFNVNIQWGKCNSYAQCTSSEAEKSFIALHLNVDDYDYDYDNFLTPLVNINVINIG